MSCSIFNILPVVPDGPRAYRHPAYRATKGRTYKHHMDKVVAHVLDEEIHRVDEKIDWTYCIRTVSRLYSIPIKQESDGIRRFALTLAEGIHQLLQRRRPLDLEEDLIIVIRHLDIQVFRCHRLLGLFSGRWLRRALIRHVGDSVLDEVRMKAGVPKFFYRMATIDSSVPSVKQRWHTVLLPAGGHRQGLKGASSTTADAVEGDLLTLGCVVSCVK